MSSSRGWGSHLSQKKGRHPPLDTTQIQSIGKIFKSKKTLGLLRFHFLEEPTPLSMKAGKLHGLPGSVEALVVIQGKPRLDFVS